MSKKQHLQLMKQTDNIQEKREIAKQYCLNHCKVTDYNYHCQRCTLVKHFHETYDETKDPRSPNHETRLTVTTK